MSRCTAKGEQARAQRYMPAPANSGIGRKERARGSALEVAAGLTGQGRTVEMSRPGKITLALVMELERSRGLRKLCHHCAQPHRPVRTFLESAAEATLSLVLQVAQPRRHGAVMFAVVPAAGGQIRARISAQIRRAEGQQQ